MSKNRIVALAAWLLSGPWMFFYSMTILPDQWWSPALCLSGAFVWLGVLVAIGKNRGKFL